MKKTLIATLLIFLPAPLRAAPGDLDTGFDSDGIVTTDVAGETDQPFALALQSDGLLVVVGSAQTGGNTDAALARYNSDGSLDTEFNETGLVTLPIGSSTDVASAVQILDDGTILIAGSFLEADADPFLARLNADGTVDTTFGTEGIVTTAVSSNVESVGGLGIDSEGRIVIGGFSGGDFFAARYTGEGELDSTFSGDGIATTNFEGGSDFGRDMTLQADDKVVVAGEATIGGNRDFALVRYGTDGELDSTFGGDGRVTTAIGSATDTAQAVAIQEDGKIVAAGFSFSGAQNNFALVRYNEDGSPDTGFNGDGNADGIITTNFGTNSEAYAVRIQADGKIVVAGKANQDFAVARYNSDGSLDNAATFGTNGTVTTDVGSTSDQAADLAIQSDGKVVVVGSNEADFVVVRYEGDTADLAVTKSASLSEAVTGDVVDFTITVTNNGPSDAGGASLSDEMSTGLSVDEGTLTISQGSCSGTAEIISCDLGILADGDTVTLTYRVTLSGAGIAANTATATAQATDPDSSNNSASTDFIVNTAGGGCSLLPSRNGRSQSRI
jgi:uncharacterized delta-60 repeat protein/uncharacterized repeat protein (TIGR01451 family)